MRRKHRFNRRLKLTKHHRKPQSKGGSSKPRNISWLEAKTHNLWHQLFWNLDAPEICQRINELFLDPDYTFQCERKAVPCGR